MKKYSMELSVGVFVFIGLICLGYLTVKLGKMEVFAQKGTVVQARFSSVAGLRAGANVEISGVSIGKVTAIELDNDHASALITLNIRPDISLTDDTIASIKTSGIIGDKYVNLSLGGGSPLGDHGRIVETESSVDIEALISKYVFGGAQ